MCVYFSLVRHQLLYPSAGKGCVSNLHNNECNSPLPDTHPYKSYRRMTRRILFLKHRTWYKYFYHDENRLHFTVDFTLRIFYVSQCCRFCVYMILYVTKKGRLRLKRKKSKITISKLQRVSLIISSLIEKCDLNHANHQLYLNWCDRFGRRPCNWGKAGIHRLGRVSDRWVDWERRDILGALCPGSSTWPRLGLS